MLDCTFHGTEGVYFLCPEGGDGKWKMVFFKKKRGNWDKKSCLVKLMDVNSRSC